MAHFKKANPKEYAAMRAKRFKARGEIIYLAQKDIKERLSQSNRSLRRTKDIGTAVRILRWSPLVPKTEKYHELMEDAGFKH